MHIFDILRHGEAAPIVSAQAQVCRESMFSLSCCNFLLWPCLEEERWRIELPTPVYILYKYFEKGSAKSKYRRPPKLTLKAAEATGYSERTVRRIVAEKSEIRAAFASPPKRCKVKEEYSTG